eukprot:CAMPEP_0197578322 /NCGR_PEP_ID=MMETSP1326-20131121/2586_1 /TAXON_ID=1155430 /ORGANISM="Genus nov. species nov., Strain RCC2288" /LENGTH=110 /DNA_ID=CAMNT_0043141491 /DNA_START=709 /DNA_END=1041 /DNA_ORIENTATION=-
MICLASDSLETFSVDQGKYINFVSSYLCPKLKNLCYDHLGFGYAVAEEQKVVLKALETGVTAIDWSTLSARHRDSLMGRGFWCINVVEGAFVFDEDNATANGWWPSPIQT